MSSYFLFLVSHFLLFCNTSLLVFLYLLITIITFFNIKSNGFQICIWSVNKMFVRFCLKKISYFLFVLQIKTFSFLFILLFIHFLGLQGDYFYIIEVGTFNVIVNGQVVAILEEGRSFGELALLYNCPRAATVRATRPCLVYSLDRDTFRNTLANSSFSKVSYWSLWVKKQWQGRNEDKKRELYIMRE